MIDDWLRLAILAITMTGAAIIVLTLWRWHRQPDHFDLRQLFTSYNPKTRKEYMSRPALAEMVALFATTAGYAQVVASSATSYETATLVYAGIWVVRGGYSTYLRSKTK